MGAEYDAYRRDVQDLVAFGERLRAHLGVRGESQAAFARRVGCSASHVSDIVRGRAMAPMYVWRAVQGVATNVQGPARASREG